MASPVSVTQSNPIDRTKDRSAPPALLLFLSWSIFLSPPPFHSFQPLLLTYEGVELTLDLLDLFSSIKCIHTLLCNYVRCMMVAGIIRILDVRLTPWLWVYIERRAWLSSYARNNLIYWWGKTRYATRFSQPDPDVVELACYEKANIFPCNIYEVKLFRFNFSKKKYLINSTQNIPFQ